MFLLATLFYRQDPSTRTATVRYPVVVSLVAVRPRYQVRVGTVVYSRNTSVRRYEYLIRYRYLVVYLYRYQYQVP